jgi:hypothetical protein
LFLTLLADLFGSHVSAKGEPETIEVECSASESTSTSIHEVLEGRVILAVGMVSVIFGFRVKGAAAIGWAVGGSRGAGIVDGTGAFIGQGFVGYLDLQYSKMLVEDLGMCYRR